MIRVRNNSAAREIAHPPRGKKRVANSNRPEYQAWCSMKHRCSNPNSGVWSAYGGRGIKVCDRWMKYENFIADMGDRPEGMSLDRIDVNGNYEPGNCRWATAAVQMQNKRVIPYKNPTWFPKSKDRAEWALEISFEF